MRRAVALCLLLVVFGCGSQPPTASPSHDVAGKQFAAPPAGRAALYVTHANLQYIEISAGQRLLGQIGKGNWLRVDLPAGDYDIRCRLMAYSSMNDTLRLSLRQGEIVFVSARFVALGDTPCRLASMPDSEGRAAVVSGQRISEISGASD